MVESAAHSIHSLLADAARRAATYLDGLGEREVSATPRTIDRLANMLDTPLPDHGVGASEVLALLDDFASPATMASAGGRYFGFVTGGALPATVAAGILAKAWDQNSFGFISSPAVAQIEMTALRWVTQVLGLPPTSEGTFVAGATMANFTCLAGARNQVLRQAGWDIDAHGLFGAPEISVIVGEEVHASLGKVLSMLGLGRNRVVRVPVDAQGQMRADKLPKISGPAIVCIQAGNVNSGGFDPAPEIIAHAHDAGAWVHVDGAFGLWAMATPRLAPLARGFELADSWATDAHKWLNVPYDCGVAIVRDPAALHHAMAISGAYLPDGQDRDALQFSPDSSRRARAVDVWAALKSLGRSGLAELIEGNCRQARAMADGLAQGGVEILNDVVLNQVVAAFGDAAQTGRVIEKVQRRGVCWCGPTTWQGRKAMRISVSSWATTDEDIEKSLASILAAFAA
ncbi:MAG: pyridoxal phosphate-dependent decarboxylase family protein [Alphaproteobacteria bacterium]